MSVCLPAYVQLHMPVYLLEPTTSTMLSSGASDPPTADCFYGDKRLYAGTVETTISGHQCKPWSHHFAKQGKKLVLDYNTSPMTFNTDLLKQYFQGGKFPGKSCRSTLTDPGDRPWCYIDPPPGQPDLTWEYCNIELCDGKSLQCECRQKRYCRYIHMFRILHSDAGKRRLPSYT